MNGRAIVNFRYSCGAMRIALIAWMADSATTTKPVLLVDALCSDLDATKQETSRRPWSQDLSMTTVHRRETGRKAVLRRLQSRNAPAWARGAIF